ncbi:MAG: hypothetical protein V7K48_13305 [Nostoc sp.]|uniref:hypothetical protein n=1 Tax=Nostoc sp. TaxID=1180 RepID=UPI002FF8C456
MPPFDASVGGIRANITLVAPKSLARVLERLETELGLNMMDKTVYQLVPHQLQTKLKVSRPQSTKQHPQSQSHFKNLIS